MSGAGRFDPAAAEQSLLSSQPSKICIVNPYEHGGGAEYQISLLIDALNAAGRYDVHVLTRFPDQRDRTRNYRMHRVGSGGNAIPRLGYLADTLSLYGTLRKLAPALIYQRVACAYTGICAAYGRRHHIPMLWHVAHDTDVSRSVLDPARNVLRIRLEKAAIAYGARRASGIICQTQFQADLLEKNFGRTAAAVIPNFHPAATETIDKSGPLTVVWIANFKHWKRPEVFIRLAQHFSAGDAVRFIMVGAKAEGVSNQPWQQELLAQVEATPNLQYAGPYDHAQVNELLARAHVFVNTSTHEGFPNTFVQAWFRDAAVVSLSVDPDQALERGGAGMLARSEPELHAAVRRLVEDRQLRQDFAKRGREHAEAHNSLRNAQELIGIFDRCRAGSSRGGIG